MAEMLSSFSSFCSRLQGMMLPIVSIDLSTAMNIISEVVSHSHTEKLD